METKLCVPVRNYIKPVIVCLLVIPLVSSFNLHQAKDSQVLGYLKQADGGATGEFPSYILDLIPELIAASTQIKSKDVVETLMAYMPFARKIMAAQSPDGQLSVEQEKLLKFTEKVVPPMMKFVQEINKGSSISNLALNEVPDYDFTTIMLKMLPDISSIINEMKARYGGWPGTDKSLEIMNAFMPLARKATVYQAQLEGRQITQEEEKYLAFTEKVVPSVMDYSQALYYKNIQPGQESQIEQLVKSAVEELHGITNEASNTPIRGYAPIRENVPFAGHHFQSSNLGPTPLIYAYSFGHPIQTFLGPQFPIAYTQSLGQSARKVLVNRRQSYDQNSEEQGW